MLSSRSERSFLKFDSDLNRQFVIKYARVGPLKACLLCIRMREGRTRPPFTGLGKKKEPTLDICIDDYSCVNTRHNRFANQCDIEAEMTEISLMVDPVTKTNSRAGGGRESGTERPWPLIADRARPANARAPRVPDGRMEVGKREEELVIQSASEASNIYNGKF